MSQEMDINKASQTQLYAHASLNLGLPVDPKMTRQDLIAEIKKVQVTDTIFTTAQVSEVGAAAKSKSDVIKERQDERRTWKEGDFFTIAIAVQPGPGGTRPVIVAVNGKAMSIPRNKPVAVPGRYVEALRNAEVTSIVGEGEERMEVVSPRHPFQVIAGPHPKPATKAA